MQDQRHTTQAKRSLACKAKQFIALAAMEMRSSRKSQEKIDSGILHTGQAARWHQKAIASCENMLPPNCTHKHFSTNLQQVRRPRSKMQTEKIYFFLHRNLQAEYCKQKLSNQRAQLFALLQTSKQTRNMSHNTPAAQWDVWQYTSQLRDVWHPRHDAISTCWDRALIHKITKTRVGMGKNRP